MAETFAKPQIIPYCEESLDGITLFDVKWIPSSARFVVLGSHVKGHGLIQIHSLTSEAKIEKMWKRIIQIKSNAELSKEQVAVVVPHVT